MTGSRANIHLIICMAVITMFLPSPVLAQAGKKLSPNAIYKARAESVVTVITDSAVGSGFFVKNGLLIATCYHVVRGAQDIKVEGSKGEKWSVGFVYTNKESDIAILKLADDAKRQPIPVGSFARLEPGDELCIIGNPLGEFAMTLSTGIVSAKRTLKNSDCIQMTAPISPGSSGSPVFNQFGEAVGVADGSIEEGQSLNIAMSAKIVESLWAEKSTPVRDFYASEKENIPKSDPNTKNSKSLYSPDNVADRQAFTEAFAKWMDRYYRLKNKHVIFLLKDLAKRDSDGNAFAEALVEYLDALLTIVLDNQEMAEYLKSGMLDRHQLAEFNGFIKEISSKAEDYVRTMIKSHNQPGNKILRNEAIAMSGQLSLMLAKPRRYLNKLNLLDVETLLRNISPSTMIGITRFNLETVFPDPDNEDGCYVGWSVKGAKAKAGALITHIQRPDSEEKVPVKTWVDLTEFITRNQDLKELVITWQDFAQRVTTETVPISKRDD